ncbi:Tn7-like transposition protein A [Bacillus pseudomycoides DSM 12442]|nr:Tn7-like transposition protein A [Bacillus pseudomycoides DSM 12442]
MWIWNKVAMFLIKLRSFAPFRYDCLKGVFFMSKRKRTSEIEKWMKQDRGSGICPDYQP